MMKASCSDTDCGFAFRTTRKHLQFAVDEVGGVACPVCQSDMHDPLEVIPRPSGPDPGNAENPNGETNEYRNTA